jgi:ribosome maturation factor RimP
LAKIKTIDQVLVGRLEGLAEDQVILLLDNGEARRVPVQEVREARLMVEFGR